MIKIKRNIQDASLDDCMAVFHSANPKTYERNDMPGSSRLGFIAQDLESNLVPEFANLLGVQYGGPEPLLTVDYSRLCCILWNVCRQLEMRVAALEAKKKTKVKT